MADCRRIQHFRVVVLPPNQPGDEQNWCAKYTMSYTEGTNVCILGQPDGLSGRMSPTVIQNANPPTVPQLHHFLTTILYSVVDENVCKIDPIKQFQSLWLGAAPWLRPLTSISEEDAEKAIVSVDPHVTRLGPTLISAVIRGIPEIASQLRSEDHRGARKSGDHEIAA